VEKIGIGENKIPRLEKKAQAYPQDWIFITSMMLRSFSFFFLRLIQRTSPGAGTLNNPNSIISSFYFFSGRAADSIYACSGHEAIYLASI
jgi:hypothetical protein